MKKNVATEESMPHWLEDNYWTDALEEYYRSRDGGKSRIVLDIDTIERNAFNKDGPAYKLMEAMCSVKEHERWDGYPGAPKLMLALLAILEKLGKPKAWK